MNTLATTCNCNCNPCICQPPPGTDVGCLPISCVPRPCFFDGQLIASDDLNAAVVYARNQSALIARFLGGFGILGGLRVDVPESPSRRVLATGELKKLTNNPQIIAGTKVQISPGLAVDAVGRLITSCTTVTVDLQQLAQASPQGQLRSGTCAELITSECTEPGPITVTEFFLVAELAETPSRPAPQFSGGGPCDPSPTCEFSRKLETPRFSLVGCLPDSYQYTGCIESPGFAVPEVTLGQAVNATQCRNEVFAFIDRVQSDLALLCCARPAVALARVLLTRDPGSLRGDLPASNLYTILSDGYPCRRPVFQAGLFTKFFPNTICSTI